MRARGRQWALGVIALGALASPGGAQSADRLDALFDAPPYDRMHIGALVVDVETGEVVYARDAARRYVPASNQKVLTTLAALERWGPDYRFHTAIEADGEVSPDGILVGDLLVRGSGDPTLSERYYDDDEHPLRMLVGELYDAGLRRVRGDLVIDALEWDGEVVEESWMWGDLAFGYGSVGGVFVVGEGRAVVEARAGEAGGAAALHWTPLGDPDRFVSAVRVVAAGDDSDLSARIRRDGFGVEVTGTLAAHTSDTIELSVQDPVMEAGLVLRRLLSDRGIDVDGRVRVLTDSLQCRRSGCGAGTVLAGLRSPPLIEIVQGILEPSQNWMAEQLLWALGRGEDGRAGWEAGTEAVASILVDGFGVDSLDLVVRDGSGLSAYNLVTPRALVGMLQGVHRRPWAAAYASALAEPGETDSTLERRLEGLRGRVFAKTGTITHVNSLSGYIDTDDGRRLAFAILTNASGMRASQVRSVVDEAVRLLADGNDE
ncbi:D-alanyl-D-alanine carboxypeptidase/D-alanyl-D-alanine-endopeptidase [Gaopeijia maritima]|uniref:D-alanyl-D-alanine carboxypeptidase/D-alanyl-D-alanine endopeptidase n=1 Tax=Gaopeijia maritima TaxID=3119007 RepID=UPI0032493F6E